MYMCKSIIFVRFQIIDRILPKRGEVLRNTGLVLRKTVMCVLECSHAHSLGTNLRVSTLCY